MVRVFVTTVGAKIYTTNPQNEGQFKLHVYTPGTVDNTVEPVLPLYETTSPLYQVNLTIHFDLPNLIWPLFPGLGGHNKCYFIVHTAVLLLIVTSSVPLCLPLSLPSPPLPS